MKRLESTNGVFDAQFHESRWVSPCCSMADSKTFDPGLILFMGHDRHFVTLVLQTKSQGDIRLDIPSGPNGEAYKVERTSHRIEFLVQIDCLGEM